MQLSDCYVNETERASVDARLQSLRDLEQRLNAEKSVDRPAIYRGHLALAYEHRLTYEIGRTIIDEVLGADNSPQAVLGALVAACRKKEVQLKGQRVYVGARGLGTAVSRSKLVSLGAMHWGNDVKAEYYVQRIEDDGWAVNRDDWNEVVAGRHLIWTSFSEDASQSDAFAEFPGTANGIRQNLGLPVWDCREDLFLLRYDAPADMKLHMPSAVEALASFPWNYYFMCAPEGERHGWTIPWDAVPESCCDADPDNVKPRPEAVHSVIRFAQARSVAVVKGCTETGVVPT